MKIKVESTEKCLLAELISRSAPISASNVKKLIKSREVKVNGVRVGENVALNVGDEVEAFVPAAFVGESATIVYADDNILIADKPRLVEVEPTLVEMLGRKDLLPLHRLDRNTVGLVVFALNETAYSELSVAFLKRTVEKHYQAEIFGRIKDGEYTDYLFKDEKKSICYVSSSPKPGYKKIITGVKEISHDGELSLIDVRLVTGRTHQIRAHLAFLGHPILGDGKYGNGELNKKYKCKYQQLCAYKIIFHDLKGEMSYLNEKVFISKQNLLTKANK